MKKISIRLDKQENRNKNKAKASNKQGWIKLIRMLSVVCKIKAI